MTSRNQSTVVRFIQRLKSKALVVAEGASPADIESFESTYRVHMPLDMIEFFLTVNGMAPGDMDPDSHIRLWPVAELQPLSDQLPDYAKSLQNAHQAFVVADYLLWSLGYVTWLDDSSIDSSPIFLVGDGPPQRIAGSFEEFIGMLADNSPDLLPLRP